jgi:hypothetical protein
MKTIILSLLIALTSVFVFTYSSTLLTKAGDKDISDWDRGLPVGFNADKDISGWDRGIPVGYNTDKDMSAWDRGLPVG